MRKYFNSALLNAGASIFFVDYLCGHTLDATHDAYYRANPASLKEEYKKYIPYLIIEKSLDYTEIPEYQEMKKELEEIKTEKETLFAEREKEITNLKLLEENRKKLEEEFKPIIDETKRKQWGVGQWQKGKGIIMQWQEVDDFNIDKKTKESTEYRQHLERLKTDQEYANKFEEYRKKSEFENAKQEKEKEIREKEQALINRMRKTLIE